MQTSLEKITEIISEFRHYVSERVLVFSHQARVSNADPDHGGSQRGGSERRQGAAEGQRSEGPAAGVHRGRGEEVKSQEWTAPVLFPYLFGSSSSCNLFRFYVQS